MTSEDTGDGDEADGQRPTDGTETGGAAAVRLDGPETLLADERARPRATGVPDGTTVVVDLTATDHTGQTWRASRRYRPVDGAVDLAAHDPVDADETDPSPAGLAWALAPVDGDPVRFPTAPHGDHERRYRAVVRDEAGREVATATTTTTVVHERGVTHRHVGGGEDADDGDEPSERSGRSDGGAGTSGPSETPVEPPTGHCYSPTGDGPHPAVVLCHGSGGVPLRRHAALLASRGYVAFALQYLGVDDLPETPVEVPLSVPRRAVRWLRAHPATTGSVGLYGVSMGGQLAALLASEPDVSVDAVVVDSGSLHVFPAGGDTAPWTRDGEPVATTAVPDAPPDRFASSTGGASDRRTAFHAMVAATDRERRRAATISAEQIRTPVLWLSGTDDATWPATAAGEALLARCDARDVTFPVDHRVYHDAGHAFGPPGLPTTWRPAGPDDRVARGGTPGAHAAGRQTAWAATRTWFDDALR
ncbi:acyl-CoA thioester hydrolase/BAAT C-terminal domain-containing protein [Halobaculum sp. MBLA0147]|uniref:acyl-CoA thioester hydrolase/BAAT C-terminal domain-containing protein n=1 Tax=Halobaculum sp. MBLA0147 TaxID=3079934 RepID=UPI0035260EC8